MIRSDAYKMVKKTMVRFMDREVIPVARELDEKEESPDKLFRKLGDMGILGIRYPEKVGGSGGNTTLFCIAMQEVARGLIKSGSFHGNEMFDIHKWIISLWNKRDA